MVKKIIFLYLIITSNAFTTGGFAQTTITELHFPYQNGYEYTMTDTTINYDIYNFPTEQSTAATRYIVTEDPKLKDILIFQRKTYDNEKEQIVASVKSFLTLGKKGMSWWRENEKTTNAIKLPLKKGTQWSSIFNEKKATMTCVTTDTILPSMYGNISCFCISTRTENTETKDYRTYTIVKEYYNVYGGKIRSEWTNYIFLFETSKEQVMDFRWSNITDSNLTVEQRQLIK